MKDLSRSSMADLPEDPASVLKRLWEQGQGPSLPSFLANLGPLSTRRLADVLRVDQEQRWQRGEMVPVERYLEAFPELADTLEDAMFLVYREVLLRCRRGESPLLDDYQKRFPSLAHLLRLQWEVHEALPLTGPVTPHNSPPEFAEAVEPPILPEYEILNILGHGGMGVVWLGRDHRLGRDVAIKVIKEEMHNSSIARRFLEEARVSSQLQHPAIPPVHALGELSDGRPYIVMKVIQGRTLAELLRERTSPSEDLGRFLGVFDQVCQALAYAHSRGVIHRDLKPANVMVGAFGEVQVMDWGLAKVLPEQAFVAEDPGSPENATPRDMKALPTTFAGISGPQGEPSSETEVGTILGTLAYMAPEQAKGEVSLVDRRTDVFALGAVLCEILTGQPPYSGQSPEELYQKVVEGNLTEARARLVCCGADQDLVALAFSCLAPEACDRPRDSQAVANALSGHFHSVQARLRQAQLAEAEARTRAKEEVKRRRLIAALAASVLLAVTLGGAGWSWVKAEREARQASVSREVREALLEASAMRVETRSTPTGGRELLARASEKVRWALALIENGQADSALADQARELRTDLEDEVRDRVLSVALEAAQLAKADTVVRDNRFSWERAVPLYRAAFIAWGLSPGEVDPEAAAARIRTRPASIREDIVAALDDWDFLANHPTHPAAEPHLDWVRALLEAADEEGWNREVRQARQQTNKEKREQALTALATNVDVSKVPARSLTLLANNLRGAAAVALLRRTQEQYPGDFWVNHDLGQALRKHTPPDHGGSVRFATAAVALRPGSPGAHNNLGNALYALGDREGARAAYRKALELDSEYAGAHSNLGGIYWHNKDIDLAVRHYQRALELDPKLIQAHQDLGIARYEQGDMAGAAACFRKVLELQPNLATAHTNLGNALRGLGETAAALASYRRAVENDPAFAEGHTNLGKLLLEKGENDEAIACYQKALALDPRNADIHASLGTALFHKGEKKAAIVAFRKAVELHPKDVVSHYNLGTTLHQIGDTEGAITSFQKALALDPKDASIHNNLGLALRDHGQVAAAILSFRKALELQPGMAKAHMNLGLSLGATGDSDGAILSYRKALECDAQLAEAHCNLGLLLGNRGQFTEAVAALQRGHELGLKRPKWPYPSAEWLQKAKRQVAAAVRLPAYLKGETQPRDNAERVTLVSVCHAKGLYRTATRLYAEVFASDPKIANDLQAAHRYSAACFASLAAAGKGAEAGSLDEAERAHLRKRALDWLRADLALWMRYLESSASSNAAEVLTQLRDWQQDTDLSAIRDSAALARLSPEERVACEAFWAEVELGVKKAKARSST